MADKSKFSLFGFRLNRSKEETPQENIPSFTTPPNEDGATTISSSAFYSQTIDLDGVVKNEVELITRYREMALQPEIDSAIEDIINEAIVQDDDGRCVDIVTDTIELSDKLREAIEEEFDNVLTLLNFKNMGSDIFRRYYVDGRLNYHVIIDNENPKKGIQELRYIDPRKIRKIREVKKQKDTETGISVITGVEEYYVYNDKIVSGTTASSGIEGIKIAADSVVNVTSGLMDARRAVVLSYLHKSIKPLNQLRMIEDASIIYKLCLVGDTRIKTDDGWKYIKDVKNGDVVYSYYGPDEGLKPTKVVKQWKTGKKQTYKVSSMHHQIVGSDNHPILVLDRQTKTVEYVDIKDLVPKKHAFVYEKPKENNESISFPEIRKEHKELNGSVWAKSKIKGKEKIIEEVAKKANVKKTQLRNFLYELQSLPTEVVENVIKLLPVDISNNLVSTYEGRCSNLQLNLPEFVDEEFARLFGFMIGDGSVGKNTLVFAEGIDEEQNLYYAGLLKKYFGECKKHKSRRKYSNYTTSSTLGAELFKKFGFVSGAKNKRIPNWLYKCSDSIKKAFIIGLSDADGYTSQSIYTGERYSTIELSNKQLIEDVKEVWNSIGLYAGKIGYRKRTENFSKVGDESSPRIMKEHESWSVRVAEYPIQQFENIISIEKAEIEDVYEIEVESEKHNFVANGIVVHNSRAPSRRIFYVNVGDMPKAKAEQYLRDMMTKYKNKVVYDASTGQVRDDRKHLSILEDFWIPRKSDGSTTEVKTLESNDNFSNMDMVEYFQRNLYKSLGVPVSRIDSQGAYNIGRSAEISREEIKFAKFIDKLRRKFSTLFDQLMRIQLVLKGICTLEEWEEYKEKLYYDFIKDNNYTELKEAELMQGRLGILAIIDPYTGKYFSKEWIQRNVLRLNDDVILDMEKQIEKEKVEDLKQQEEDQKNQIVLQAQGLQLQNQLMPQPDQQIDAGAEEQPQEEPAPRKQAHPYEV